MKTGISFSVILLILLGAVFQTGAEGDGDSEKKQKAELSVDVVLPDKPIPAETRVQLLVKIRNVGECLGSERL